MKKIISILVLGVAIFSFAFSKPALADGAGLFGGNCAACHAGGKNVINPMKTLSKADLEKNDRNTLEKVVSQVTNGAGAMPPFKGRLNDAQIQEVAAYVLEQAEAGW